MTDRVKTSASVQIKWNSRLFYLSGIKKAVPASGVIKKVLYMHGFPLICMERKYDKGVYEYGI